MCLLELEYMFGYQSGIRVFYIQATNFRTLIRSGVIVSYGT